MFRSICLVILTLVAQYAVEASAETQEGADDGSFDQCEALFVQCTNAVREDIRLCHKYTAKDFICEEVYKPYFLECLADLEDCALPSARIVSQ